MKCWEKPSMLENIPDNIDYLLIIDESGTSNVDALKNRIYDGKEISDNESKLIIGGVLITVSNYTVLQKHFDKLRIKFWPNGFWESGKNKEIVHFHSYDIRSKKGAFRSLYKLGQYEEFIAKLSSIIDDSKFHVISCCLDIERFIEKYSNPYNPYLWTTFLIIERFSMFLTNKNSKGIIIFEQRNRNSDMEILTFINALKRGNFVKEYNFPKHDSLNMENIESVWFNRKTSNNKEKSYVGIEISDLITFPIAKWFRSSKTYRGRDWEIVEKKFMFYPNYIGKGLKIFP